MQFNYPFTQLLNQDASDNADCCRMPSTSARSAGVGFQPAAAAFERICWAEVAPAMTEGTTGRASSQENANSSRVWPRDSAKRAKPSIRPWWAFIRSEQQLATEAVLQPAVMTMPATFAPASHRVPDGALPKQSAPAGAP